MGLMSFAVRSVFGLDAGRLWLSVCWLLTIGRGVKVPRNTAPSHGALPRCAGGNVGRLGLQGSSGHVRWRPL